MDSRNDIKDDYKAYCDNKRTPIFYRLKFGNVSFYLTKTYFHNEVATGSNSFGYYRIFSWDDWRSKELLGLELGEDNPVHGPVELIGRFTPVENDLKNCQYHSLDGRTFYQSARAAVKGQSPARDKSVARGDGWGKFRMDEIIPTGVQGKAIYGEGDYIIDGPAGTGKSTTAIQKIKLLTKNSGIEPNRIIVVVRSEQLQSEFLNLLRSLDISDVRVLLIAEFMAKLPYDSNSVQVSELETVLATAKGHCQALRLIEQEIASLDNAIAGKVGADLSKTAERFSRDRISYLAVDRYASERAKLFTYYRKKKDELGTRKKAVDQKINWFREECLKERWKKRAQKRGEDPNDLPSFHFIEENLSFDERGEVSHAVAGYRLKLIKELKIWQNGISKQLRQKHDLLKVVFERLKSRLLEDEVSLKFAENRRQAILLNLHLKRLLQATDVYHTIIFDEAQKARQADIHHAWLNSRNLVLTGDEMQADASDGISGWSNLGAIQGSFKENNKLNIFTLKNNFRQTFELGACSHSFRQLSLGHPIEDISDEYFENQKGFPKPGLATINSDSELVLLLKTKIQLAKTSFERPTPVVLVYEGEAPVQRVIRALKKIGITFGFDGDESKEIMFVGLSDIAGRSFPILIAPLMEKASDQALYILLSRARFDLTVFAEGDKPVNSKILSLRNQGFFEEFRLR